MFNKKILCWGHNGTGTDHVVSMLANADNATNHGLISGGMFVPESFGYYHTSIVDSSSGEILQFAERLSQKVDITCQSVIIAS